MQVWRDSAEEKNLPFSGFASSQTVPEPAGRAKKTQTESNNQRTKRKKM